jgi:HEPN domain-containing protein
MAPPQPKEARLYWRAAKQRAEDADMLLQGGRTTGAVYLAGYTVECFLKALILAGAAPRLRQKLLSDFRGGRAHNLEWLSVLYRRHVRLAIPRQVAEHLTRAASWTTNLRYETGALNKRDADDFMESVRTIVAWAERGM